jgi:flagellar hook-basal body complex protein FliE
MSGIESLYASSIYGQTQNREVVKSTETLHSHNVNGSEFQKVFETNFNSYSKLSPSEILAKIRSSSHVSSSSQAVTLDFSNLVKKEVINLRESLSNHEFQTQRAAMGEANLVELMTTSAKAKNLLNTFVALRDEAKNAWDKIFTMSL